MRLILHIYFVFHFISANEIATQHRSDKHTTLCWENRLPFGIMSAPEHFQQRISEILHSIICLIHDILLHGRSKKEHNQGLLILLQRLQNPGVMLNI